MSRLLEKRLEADAKKRPRERDRVLKKQDAASKALAQQVLTKVTPALTSLTLTCNKPGSLHLPDMVSGAARESIEALSKLDKSAKLVMEGHVFGLSGVTAKDVSAAVTKAKKTEMLATQMMNSMSKLT